MIEVKNLTKHYGQIQAVKDISFTVNKGEILGFLGPNGAGKTTTMKMLTCFIPPTSGTVSICGYDIFYAHMEVKRRIGYLPEQPPLYQDMTVKSYLKFVANIKGVYGKKASDAMDRVLERCAINGVKERLISHLSKGYQQRVGIAQALIHNPDVLILDEPTVGLDPKQIIEIRSLIKELSKDHTIILSSHILPEITMTCQRVVIINEGRIAAVDSIDRLSSNLRRSEKVSVEVRVLDDALIEKIKGINGIVYVNRDEGGANRLIVEAELGRDLRDEIAKVIVHNGYPLLEMRPVSLTLEDVFLKLTTNEDGVL